MPNVCRTCREPRRAYLDRQVLTGRSLRGIANEVGVSYASLRAHVEKQHHLKEGLKVGNYLPPKAAAVADDREAAHFATLDRLYAEVGKEQGIDPATLKRHHDLIPDHDPCALCDALDIVEARQ